MADGSTLNAVQLLQLFQFPPEVQHGFVSKLSGGEKKRLFLLTILMTNPNFLILDEPTNDLDLVTLGVLEDFLSNFPGCLLIVTHDRYFMDRLTDQLFVFEGNGHVRGFIGNYGDYRIIKEIEEKSGQRSTADSQRLEAENSMPHAPSSDSDHGPLTIDHGKGSVEKRKLSYKEKQELELLDKRIPEIEKRREELNQLLIDHASDHEKLLKLGAEMTALVEELETAELRWLELSEG